MIDRNQTGSTAGILSVLKRRWRHIFLGDHHVLDLSVVGEFWPAPRVATQHPSLNDQTTAESDRMCSPFSSERLWGIVQNAFQLRPHMQPVQSLSGCFIERHHFIQVCAHIEADSSFDCLLATSDGRASAVDI